MYEISCPICGRRTEDCECEPGAPFDYDDPFWEQIYGRSRLTRAQPDAASLRADGDLEQDAAQVSSGS